MLVLLACLARPSFSPGEGASSDVLQDIVGARREALRGLTTLEYTSVVRSGDNPPIQQKFICDREMFRSSLEAVDAPTPFRKDVAFDGSVYQELDTTQSTLSVTRTRAKAPYLALEALTASHIFALPPAAGYDVSLDTLQGDEVWAKFLAASAFVEYRQVQGHESAIVRTRWPAPDGPVIYEVAFAKDADWYPILVEARDSAGRIMSRMQASVTTIKGDDGVSRRLPCALDIAAFDPQGAAVGPTQLTVDERSIRVSHPVAREIFLLPRNQASTFVDVDLHVSTDTALDALGQTAQAQALLSAEKSATRAGTSQGASSPAARENTPSWPPQGSVPAPIVGTVLNKRRLVVAALGVLVLLTVLAIWMAARRRGRI